MSQRKSVSGRPSGTDGSDFSYRMVVDSRYTKVTKGKSRLCSLILAQGFIQLLAAVVLSSVNGAATLDRLSIASNVIYFISLIIGEFGRKRSRVGLLKSYLFGSSISILLSIFTLLTSEKSLEFIKWIAKDSSTLEAANLELLKISVILLGALVQILAVSVTTSLIGNMAPPKRAS